MGKINRIKDKEKIFKQRLLDKKGKSFELIGEYENQNVKAKFKHNECGYEWYTTPACLLHSKYGCPKCSKNNKGSTEEFKEEIKHLVGDEFTLVDEYINSKTKIKIKHNKCDRVFSILPNDFKSRKRCSLCGYEKRLRSKTKTIEMFKEDVFNLVGNEYTVLSEEYFNWMSKIKFKNNECGHIFVREANAFLQGSTLCPKCSGFSGEVFLSKILDSNHIQYETQKSYEDLKDKKKFLFDFYLPKYNMLIEYQGKQHYEPIEFFGGIKAFKKQKKRDAMKKEYALKNNIQLIEIPYTEKTYEDIKKYLSKYINIIS